MWQLILYIIACCIEGVMDRLYEVYKLGIIERKRECKNLNWFSYNPLEAEKGFGICRDAWHTLKGVYHCLIYVMVGWIVAVPPTIPFFDYRVEWYWIILSMIVIRGIFFQWSLIVSRNKINVQNNLREDKN